MAARDFERDAEGRLLVARAASGRGVALRRGPGLRARAERRLGDVAAYPDGDGLGLGVVHVAVRRGHVVGGVGVEHAEGRGHLGARRADDVGEAVAVDVEVVELGVAVAERAGERRGTDAGAERGVTREGEAGDRLSAGEVFGAREARVVAAHPRRRHLGARDVDAVVGPDPVRAAHRAALERRARPEWARRRVAERDQRERELFFVAEAIGEVSHVVFIGDVRGVEGERAALELARLDGSEPARAAAVVAGVAPAPVGV